MYNFLDPKLSPKVSTLAAALDDYEVSNLVSPDFRTRARGFMAFTSIKPPVDIKCEFLCNIQVRYIKLQTTLGSHKTIGIEVLAADSLGSLTSLGTQIYDESKPGLLMCDSKFYHKNNIPIAANAYHVAYFKSYQHRVFTNTNKLCIRILKTDSRSVPCIGMIEVWGFVAKNVSDETRQTINKIMMQSIDTNQTMTTNNAHSLNNILLKNKDSDFTIPDDFKDALTFEVMALPMTLPSGNTIDNGTLEKCINNDASYGRKPCDPFTGLEFLPNRKPAFNSALKSRIDLFLLKNNDQNVLKSVGRTLGSGKTKRQAIYGDIHCRQTNYSSKLCVEPPGSPHKRPRLACDQDQPNSGSSTSNNLDDAIAKVVSNERFICFTKSEEETIDNKNKIDETICDKCKCNDNLYSIAVCEHIFCRPCLFQLQNICGNCKVKFVNQDVSKVIIR